MEQQVYLLLCRGKILPKACMARDISSLEQNERMPLRSTLMHVVTLYSLYLVDLTWLFIILLFYLLLLQHHNIFSCSHATIQYIMQNFQCFVHPYPWGILKYEMTVERERAVFLLREKL
jgi:hypothetical protein